MLPNLPEPCGDGCNAGRRRRGYCTAHYQKYLKDGSIDRVLFLDNTEGFWARIVKGETEDDCWQWTASTTKDGYGRLYFNGRNDLAHRVSFFLHNGIWPDGMALHTCDNPPRCNPKHLYDGGARENARDMIERNRQMPAHLKRPPAILSDVAKLSAKKMNAIVAELGKGWLISSIAQRNNVTEKVVRSVQKIGQNGTNPTSENKFSPEASSF